MVTHFYKSNKFENAHGPILVCSKNIDCIPSIGTYIKHSGQCFIVIKVILDIDNAEYNVYMTRV